MRNATLLFLIKRDEQGTISDICLAMKKRGFGAGRFNGVGGKVSENESIEEATIRETKEEIDVDVSTMEKVAELSFTFPHNPDWNQIVHTYFTDVWDGEPKESEEMDPKWFKVSDIPFETMWPDDIIWLPKALSGDLLKCEFTFEEGDKISNQNVKIVEKL
jgi:8-oxo-dGTP pyrophosphatase MutT (NUDIX family)